MDQVSIRGVYTQEANAEAEEIINSPKNFINIQGTHIRKLGNEGVQALFELTKD